MRVARKNGGGYENPEGRAPRGSHCALLVTLVVLLFTLAVSSTTQAQGGAAQSPPVVKPTRQTPRPAPVAEYRVRVREAFALLEALATEYDRVSESEKYEVWSKKGFNSDFVANLPREKAETFAKVRELLPQKEKVEWSGAFIETDNGWLDRALSDSERTGANDKTAAALRAAAGRLRALDARLAEMSGGTAAPAIDRDAERGRLNSILRGQEYAREVARQQQGGALRRLVEEFFIWLIDVIRRLYEFIFGRVKLGASPHASQFAQILVLSICVLVLAYVARWLWLRRGRRVKSTGLKRGARVVLGERLEEDQTAADLLEEAERLARSGQLRAAIRKSYVALLCELGDRGVVRLAQHKTNRDYLDAVRRASRPRLYTEMLPLTSDFERHWYGLRDASEADWDTFRARCRQALKESGV